MWKTDGVGFVNWQFHGVSVDGGRRREHNVGHVVLFHGFKQQQGSSDVVVVVKQRQLRRFTNSLQTCKVDDGGELILGTASGSHVMSECTAGEGNAECAAPTVVWTNTFEKTASMAALSRRSALTKSTVLPVISSTLRSDSAQWYTNMRFHASVVCQGAV